MVGGDLRGCREPEVIVKPSDDLWCSTAQSESYGIDSFAGRIKLYRSVMFKQGMTRDNVALESQVRKISDGSGCSGQRRGGKGAGGGADHRSVAGGGSGPPPPV